MRGISVVRLLAAFAGMALVACAPQAAPGAGQGPSATPGGGPAAASSPNWDQVVAAANQEGKVVVIGSGNNNLPTLLSDNFTRRYPQITVSFTGMDGSQVLPRLENEHAAGQMSTDVVLKGTTGGFALADDGALADLQPYLSGPDVQPENWQNGHLTFADTGGKLNLVYSAYVKLGWFYNTQQVASPQFTSWQDLLDPRWKGKIIMSDPTVSDGSGESIVQYWYDTPSLGQAFIQQFFTQQDVTLARDDQQIINAVGQGAYSIGLGTGDNGTVQGVKKGLPIAIVDARTLQETPYMIPGVGAVTVPLGAPDPNAAKVYLDWFLSQEGQTVFSQATGLPSLRQDVLGDGVYDALIPQPGVSYPLQGNEASYHELPEVHTFLSSVLGGGPPA